MYLQLCTVWSILQFWTTWGSLGQSKSPPNILICIFKHTNWFTYSRSCLGKSLDLSKIPNWRVPVAISQIFCCEECWEVKSITCLKWVPYLKPVHYIYAVSMQRPSGEFLDQGNNDLVRWVCTQAPSWYQITPQL